MDSDFQFGKRARALGPHGTVAVVSLASCVERAALEAGCRALRALSGWQVETPPVALECADGFAGTPGSRAAALMQMWQRDDVDAIVCSRGGYGSNYLLPLLDFDALQSAPKPFVGYSDNTSLLLALDRAGLVSFHGPMVASDFSGGRADPRAFLAALSGEPLDFVFPGGSEVQSLVAGEAHASITGGCLSVVVTSLGTPWEIECEGKILFLEDVNEKLFRIDRMLMHLLLAGKFHGVRAIIFGAMLGCSPRLAEEEALPQMIRRILGHLGIPIVLGFPSGHVERGNLTLPFGVPALLHSSGSGVRLRVSSATLVETQLSHP
jgi:muramoyltetrapeptide carboxypeptidase